MMLFSIGTGLERVGVAGSDPDSWLIRDAGYWIVGAGVGLLLLLIGRLWVWPSPARRTKGKEGRRGLCPWPLRCLSQILSERKREHSDCLVLAYGSAYLSLLGWLCIYNVCCSQFEGRKDSFLLDEIFLAFIE